MTVYIDVIFFENLFMNYIILQVLKKLLKTKTIIYRQFVSSLIGAIYSLLVCIFNYPFLNSFILKIILSIIIVYVFLKFQNIKRFIKGLIYFYLISFFLGGMCFAIIYFFNIKQTDIIYFTIFLIGYLFFVFFEKIILLIKSSFFDKNIYYDLEIYYMGKNIKVYGMLDTGNHLKEPFTGNPVIIVYKKIFNDFFGKDFLEDEKNKLSEKITIIPFKTVGVENGLMIGVKPEKVKIKNDNDYLEKDNIVIAFSNKPLSNKYDALLGLEAIN